MMGEGEGKEECEESTLVLQRLVSVTKTLLRVLDYVLRHFYWVWSPNW